MLICSLINSCKLKTFVVPVKWLTALFPCSLKRNRFSSFSTISQTHCLSYYPPTCSKSTKVSPWCCNVGVLVAIFCFFVVFLYALLNGGLFQLSVLFHFKRTMGVDVKTSDRVSVKRVTEKRGFQFIPGRLGQTNRKMQVWGKQLLNMGKRCDWTLETGCVLDHAPSG